MKLSDFDYHLPPERIARYPLPERSASRLLCLDTQGKISHKKFTDIMTLIAPGDLLVFNDTRVIPARLFGCKKTGGQIEVLVERILNKQEVLVQMRVSKPPKAGDDILFADGAVKLKVMERNGGFYVLRHESNETGILTLIETLGHIPLPHYMGREAEELDKERYQTVYAKYQGSVAAPTAGLHFDEALLNQLRAKKVNMGFLTLHVGAGTFMPVRVDNILEHRMHAEYLEVSAELCAQIEATKASGKKVIAVGTTSMRALETACQSGSIAPYHGETQIFIYPGYEFRCADALITNLHLPGSTLLMLVAAFGGYRHVMQAYQEAVAQDYRFFSYGDAMWLEKNPEMSHDLNLN